MTLFDSILDYALIETDIEGALRVFILVSVDLIDVLLVFLYLLLLVAAVLHNVVLMLLFINNCHIIKLVSDRLVMWDRDDVR